MTKNDLIAKYKPYPTYVQIAKEGYEVGLKEGREENKNQLIRNLEKENEELRAYKISMESTLHDPEKLACLIGGL
ncbi:hypothetical protein BTO06_09910 [Tenacibaculum sp. SZ-18]|uniref:hypothetical protein n=1 Tax=Tenacibaculum sp. SZ-18 TaxID=754423 RepID=UPI000C2CF997|nr:hypothetical protein [Tenacibaculum sp. SZ-18]AUC15435.1 hypothetical protein BTO06_09910 [Tenacibaculum sp. SZ-18]